MKKRRLGSTGLEVSAIGLGCMGMSETYGSASDNESVKTILTALENGVTMLDTADKYGKGHNEKLISKALKEWNDDIIIATKFGFDSDKGDNIINGRPEYVKKAVEASLKRLDIDYIDLYYYHRLDKSVPIEETVGAMAELVKEGKIGYIGLSEMSSATIKRASKIHPVTAVQSEYSLWSREVESEMLETLKNLGIGFVPYSPLGRGFLSENFSFSDNDVRKFFPRFQKENYKQNKKLIEDMNKISKDLGITTAQLSLAWVLSRDENIVPIPGTKRITYLLENIQAVDIVLTSEIINKLDKIFNIDNIMGERYPDILKGLQDDSI